MIATPTRLMDMLGFDYFKLLDLLTIARSRKHIEKYYGTQETGRFPERLKPINIKPDVDRAGEFRSIREINNEIRRLNLSAYAPLRYVLPHKQAAYDEKYSTKLHGGERFFRQADREESLIHLLRVNILKRMESAVTSFASPSSGSSPTSRPRSREIDAHDRRRWKKSTSRTSTSTTPASRRCSSAARSRCFCRTSTCVRWRQDSIEDRNRLATLHVGGRQVGAARDAKLQRAPRIDRGQGPATRSIPATARSSSSPPSPTPPSISTASSRGGR